MKSNKLIYQARTGGAELPSDAMKRAHWATRMQKAETGSVETRADERHSRNPFDEMELPKVAPRSASELAQTAVTRTVTRSGETHALDAINSVGHRIYSTSRSQRVTKACINGKNA